MAIDSVVRRGAVGDPGRLQRGGLPADAAPPAGTDGRRAARGIRPSSATRSVAASSLSVLPEALDSRFSRVARATSSSSARRRASRCSAARASARGPAARHRRSGRTRWPSYEASIWIGSGRSAWPAAWSRGPTGPLVLCVAASLAPNARALRELVSGVPHDRTACLGLYARRADTGWPARPSPPSIEWPPRRPRSPPRGWTVDLMNRVPKTNWAASPGPSTP